MRHGPFVKVQKPTSMSRKMGLLKPELLLVSGTVSTCRRSLN